MGFISKEHNFATLSSIRIVIMILMTWPLFLTTKFKGRRVIISDTMPNALIAHSVDLISVSIFSNSSQSIQI